MFRTISRRGKARNRHRAGRAPSEKQRASDERLRKELAEANPEKFKRLVKSLFRSSTEKD